MAATRFASAVATRAQPSDDNDAVVVVSRCIDVVCGSWDVFAAAAAVDGVEETVGQNVDGICMRRTLARA